VFELSSSPIRIFIAPILCTEVSASSVVSVYSTSYEQFKLADTHRAVKYAPGRILVDFFCSMVRTPFFAPDKTSTLSRAKEDAATARKPLVESASTSGVGHPVVGTAAVEAGTGTSREVGIEVADSAAGMEAAVGAAAVETGMGTSREMGMGTAESASVVEAEVSTAAVETGAGTSGEVGIGSAAVAEAEGGVMREGTVDADGKVFTTASVEIPSLPSKDLQCLVEKSAIYIIESVQNSPFSSLSWVH
jgi:hypothetical protein